MTFVATVAAVSSGTPGGTVTFSDGGTALATVRARRLRQGDAHDHRPGRRLEFDHRDLQRRHQLPRRHSQALTESVAQAGTQVVLVPEPVFNSKHKLVSVGLKAEIEPVSPGGGVPTGMVTFETVTATKKTKKLGTLAERRRGDAHARCQAGAQHVAQDHLQRRYRFHFEHGISAGADAVGTQEPGAADDRPR